MATERQRAKKLDDNIKDGAKRVKSTLRRSQRSVTGTITQYTKLPNFVTNAAVRNKLFTELAKEYKVLNSNINDWVESEVNVTSKNFWSYAKEDLPKGAVSGTFGQFSDKYVSDIIGSINPATIDKQVAMNSQIGGMLTNDVRAIRAAVSTTIAEGAVEGLTNPQMARRMTEKVAKSTGAFKFVDKAGRNWTADNYFGMLNRTLHANAARETYIDTATKELGYDLYAIEGGVTGSSVENSSDPCDAWAGRIISMTGGTKGYPTYADAQAAGVFHPNCVHFIRALLPTEIPEAKEQQAEERKIAGDLPTKEPKKTADKKLADKFVPAKTVKDAELFAKDRISEKVDFRSVDAVKNINAVTRTVSGVQTKYGLNKIKELDFGTGNPDAGGMANYKTLKLNTKLLKTPNAIEGAVFDKGVYSRFAVSDSYKGVRKIEAITNHEMGHVVADQLFGQINGGAIVKQYSFGQSKKDALKSAISNPSILKKVESGDLDFILLNNHAKNQSLIKEWDSIWKELSTPSAKKAVSEYGYSSKSELFAEMFSMFEMGETVPVSVSKFINGLKK